MRFALTAALALTALAIAACGSSKESSSAGAGAGAAASGLATPENLKRVAELGPAYAKADLDNGQTRFALCRSCHTIAQGGPNMTGPNLYGLFGRKAASVEGYAYSDSLKSQTYAWDAAHLDAWIKDPKSVAAGTKMSFMGLKDDKDRADLIAYLKVASSGGAN